MKTISIVISVYKKVKELEILLSALKRQTHKDFDVIIADDGSGELMRDFIIEYSRERDYEIIYLTQEDKGFRKNRILNEAIRTSRNDYLIFLDCDCIPHKDFVKAHYENIENDTILIGRRVHLNEYLSELLSKEYVLTKSFDRFYLKALAKSFRKKNATSTAEEGIVLNNKLLRKFLRIRNNHIVGCNFSVSKELLLKINGFDENYVGAGIGEDTDLEYRLSLINAKFKSVRNLAVVFHMYHTKTVESNTNYDYFHLNVKTKNVFYCENGIFKPENNIQG
jgi:GT2 family glycosyltransferase